ncbi:MAG: hypothetical protein JWQ72_1830 [Polaromonas sp.]|nr:hypothetical protein [Polaromonas sp.]
MPLSSPSPQNATGTMPADALLVQATVQDAAGLAPWLRRLQAAAEAPGDVRAAWSPVHKLFYGYLLLPERRTLPKNVPANLETALAGDFPQLKDIRVSRLEQVFSADGASAGVAPVFHYVVEMDPEPGWMPELSQWYDTEHMPGLARVPGCIRASRFLNHDHGPLSLACYDLVTEDTLGSPPWLAVRGTPWSDRMRPRFTNTKRTMLGSCA